MTFEQNSDKYRIIADESEHGIILTILQGGTWAPCSAIQIPTNDDPTVLDAMIHVLSKFNMPDDANESHPETVPVTEDGSGYKHKKGVKIR